MPVRPKKRSTARLIGWLPRARRIVDVADVLTIVDDEDRVGRSAGERDRARDLVLADDGGRDQQTGDAGFGEDFRLAQPGGAAANRAGAHQRSATSGHLCVLPCGRKALPRDLTYAAIFCDVVFESVEIEQQGRGRDLVTIHAGVR